MPYKADIKLIKRIKLISVSFVFGLATHAISALRNNAFWLEKNSKIEFGFETGNEIKIESRIISFFAFQTLALVFVVVSIHPSLRTIVHTTVIYIFINSF